MYIFLAVLISALLGFALSVAFGAAGAVMAMIVAVPLGVIGGLAQSSRSDY